MPPMQGVRMFEVLNGDRGHRGYGSSVDIEGMLKYVDQELAANADPERAPQMAAYLKTDMAFYGVTSPQRKPIARHLKTAYAPETRKEYETVIRALWARPTREEKYLALDYATAHRSMVQPASLALYETLVREGAWWDFVDHIASHLVGGAFQKDRPAVEPTIRRWIDDPDMWIRRTAILSQLRHKEETDQDLLFGLCLKRCHEKEFFIRKAIGWALRSYARVAPDEVTAFLVEHRAELSGLSFREAAKHLDIS